MTTRSVPKIIFIICLVSYLVIRSFRYWGLSLFIIVNASITIIRIRLTFKECYSDLARSSLFTFGMVFIIYEYCSLIQLLIKIYKI
jgi:hypothetical protein